MHRYQDPKEQLLDRAIAWFGAHGVGNTSMRTLAGALGTSGRMLNYHFGSRDELLQAIIRRVESAERDVATALLDSHDDLFEAVRLAWAHVADTTLVFAPLYFELAAHAMRGVDHARTMRGWLADGWTTALVQAYARRGLPPVEAEDIARASLAMARGLLFDLAVTGDRERVDRCMALYTSELRRRLEGPDLSAVDG